MGAIRAEDLKRGQIFTDPTSAVSVRERDTWRWKPAEVTVTNVRRYGETPEDIVIYYKDNGGNKYKSDAAWFLEKYGEFLKEGRMKKRAQVPTPPEQSDMVYPNEGSTALGCPYCGNRPDWDILSSEEYKNGAMYKCAECGYSFFVTTPNDQDLGSDLPVNSKRKSMKSLKRALDMCGVEKKASNETIIEGATDAFFGSAWMEFEEEQGRSLSQMEILDVMPTPPPEAQKAAEDLISEIERQNKIDFDMAVLPGETQEPGERDPKEDYNLGFYLAMEALGHGVSWSDDHEPHGLEIPWKEFYIIGENPDGTYDIWYEFSKTAKEEYITEHDIKEFYEKRNPKKKKKIFVQDETGETSDSEGKYPDRFKERQGKFDFREKDAENPRSYIMYAKKGQRDNGFEASLQGTVVVAGEGDIDLADMDDVHIGMVWDDSGYTPASAIYVMQGWGSQDVALQEAFEILEDHEIQQYPEHVAELEAEWGDRWHEILTEGWNGAAWTMKPKAAAHIIKKDKYASKYVSIIGIPHDEMEDNLEEFKQELRSSKKSDLSMLKTKLGQFLEDYEEEDFDNPIEPAPEDIVMTPSGTLGGRTSVSVVEGEFIGEFSTDEEAEQAIREYGHKHNFFPTVWWMSDHGNLDVVNFDWDKSDIDACSLPARKGKLSKTGMHLTEDEKSFLSFLDGNPEFASPELGSLMAGSPEGVALEEALNAIDEFLAVSEGADPDYPVALNLQEKLESAFFETEPEMDSFDIDDGYLDDSFDRRELGASSKACNEPGRKDRSKGKGKGLGKGKGKGPLGKPGEKVRSKDLPREAQMTNYDKDPDRFQAEAEQAIEETRNRPDFAYSGDLPLGETWALTFGMSRDSDKRTESNFEAIQNEMESKFPEDVQVIRSSHWGHGWVEELAVRMLDENGKITPAGVEILEFNDALESYPVINDEDLSRREHEAQIESIEWNSPSNLDMDNIPDDWANKVFDWLWDNKQEALYDEEQYVATEDIEEAAAALGFLLPDEEEEEDLEPWKKNPDQTDLL